MPDEYKILINFLHLPKFIWICEIYEFNDYIDEKASGILILDSHGDDTEKSIILYLLKDFYMRSNGNSLSEPLKLQDPFYKKGMYRNNLE